MQKNILLIIALIGSCFSGTAQNNQLQYYIDNALHNSPLLKDYQNQVQLNKYDSLLIRAAFKPQVTGSSINSYVPVIRGWGYDDIVTNGGGFATLVGVNKSIPNKKNLVAQFENIGLQNQSIANTSQITEQDLKRTIIAQYITADGSLQQLNVNKEISNLLYREEAILKKLTQSNVYKQADYLAFLVTLQQQDLLVKQLAIQYNNDFGTLKYLSGIADTSTVLLQNPDINLKPLPGITQSVFFKQFEIDSLKLSNNKRLVDINYRPKINLYADAGFNSTLAYSAYKNFGTSFGVSLIVPVYDGKQKQLQYSKIDIAEKTRVNYQSFFTKQYRQQIAQLTQQLSATDDLINDINNQLKYTQSLIDVNGKLLGTGEVRVTDYIIALNNYINAKNLITQNNISRLQIINQLNYWNR
jgi:outer membrane protein TolC